MGQDAGECAVQSGDERLDSLSARRVAVDAGGHGIERAKPLRLCAAATGARRKVRR